MSDDRASARRDRTDLLARLVGTPGPGGAVTARTWAALDDPDRRRLRRAATAPDLVARVDEDAERAVVQELARQQAGWRAADVAVPLLTGLLVLSTLWGFGRAVFPATAAWWLAAGVLGLAVATAAGLRRATVRRRAAAAVLRALAPARRDPDGPAGP